MYVFYHVNSEGETSSITNFPFMFLCFYLMMARITTSETSLEK